MVIIFIIGVITIIYVKSIRLRTINNNDEVFIFIDLSELVSLGKTLLRTKKQKDSYNMGDYAYNIKGSKNPVFEQQQAIHYSSEIDTISSDIELFILLNVNIIEVYNFLVLTWRKCFKTIFSNFCQINENI